jgi:hypothetical protein
VADDVTADTEDSSAVSEKAEEKREKMNNKFNVINL